MGRSRRAWHPGIPGPGVEITLDAEQSHHVVQVLRLRAGEILSVFDGRGGEWAAELVAAERSGARVRVGAVRTDRVEPPLSITLHQGLCRPDRMDWVVQKATEVGASRIRPTAAARSEERAPGPDRIERWRRIAREAARQSGRRVVPDVDELGPLPLEPPMDALAVVLATGPDAPPLGTLLTVEPVGDVRLLVGPEGGLEDAELEALSAAGWRPAGLGPRTLRTETAGVVACALVLHAWGDLGARTTERA